MKIKVSNWFLLILAFSIVTNGIKPFIFTILCCILHEFGHIIPIYIFGCKIETIKLTLIGGSIKSYQLHKLSYVKQFIVFSGGILVNILFAVLCNFIAMKGFHSLDFFMLSGINILLASFNALPIKILDGYNCLFSFLMTITRNQILTQKTLNFVSISVNIIILLLTLISVKYKNFSLILICFSLFLAQKIKSK